MDPQATAQSEWEWKSRRATGKHYAGAPEDADANGYEYDATATSRRTNPMAAATATSTTADATAAELWVWDTNATALWWHGPADTNIQQIFNMGQMGGQFFFWMSGSECVSLINKYKCIQQHNLYPTSNKYEYAAKALLATVDINMQNVHE